MKFQRIFVYLSIAAICLFATINAGAVLRLKRSPQDGGIDFCAEDTEFPAWKNFFAFLGKLSIFLESKFLIIAFLNPVFVLIK